MRLPKCIASAVKERKQQGCVRKTCTAYPFAFSSSYGNDSREDLVHTCLSVPTLHPHAFQLNHAKQNRNQPYSTDVTLLKCLTCQFCVYKVSHTSSAL